MIVALLIVIAVIFEILAAVQVASRMNLTAVGLVFFMLSFLVPFATTLSRR
jgi:hypothetical protein